MHVHSLVRLREVELQPASQACPNPASTKSKAKAGRLAVHDFFSELDGRRFVVKYTWSESIRTSRIFYTGLAQQIRCRHPHRGTHRRTPRAARSDSCGWERIRDFRKPVGPQPYNGHICSMSGPEVKQTRRVVPTRPAKVGRRL